MSTESVTEMLNRVDAARAAATPGPWLADSHEIYEAISVEHQIPGEWVGETCLADDSRRGDANAALIVAAVNALPQLTAALRAVLDLADELDHAHRPIRHPGTHPIADRIRAAVTAAVDDAR